MSIKLPVYKPMKSNSVTLSDGCGLSVRVACGVSVLDINSEIKKIIKCSASGVLFRDRRNGRSVKRKIKGCRAVTLTKFIAKKLGM